MDRFDVEGAKEETPLLSKVKQTIKTKKEATTCHEKLFNFLEAKTKTGLHYEIFTILLILLNVASFIIGSMYIPRYNYKDMKNYYECDELCDALWFGNMGYNSYLDWIGIGPTSILELVTVFVFSIDYLLRIWTADLINDRYSGFCGRILFLPSFFSMVDLISIVPFYVDVALTETNLTSSQFLRIFRLFRMMKVEGRRYNSALCMYDDVLRDNYSILGTALFIGMTTWIATSTLYYIAERYNTDMIYCNGSCSNNDNMDTSLCIIDNWGSVNCSNAGCSDADNYCYNVYQSIPSASYYTLLNLFGEFPLIDSHSIFGKVVGTFAAIIAVTFFGLPVGIIGGGLTSVLEKQTNNNQTDQNDDDDDKDVTLEKLQQAHGDAQTLRGNMYNFFHAITTPLASYYDHLLNVLVLGTTFTFMISTVSTFDFYIKYQDYFNTFEFISVCCFTIDYIFKFYCITENSTITSRVSYSLFNFLPLVDFISFAPYWIAYYMHAQNMLVVKFMRLFRIFRFERYTRAFTTFDDIIRQQMDMFEVAGIGALILWIFFSSIMYWSERNNDNEEIASYYNNVPNAMWITLLNLAGECPLAYYTLIGQITAGVMGVFATGLFGIPIGILGNCFNNNVDEKEAEEENDEQSNTRKGPSKQQEQSQRANKIEIAVYKFVNGEAGTCLSQSFEISIYVLILLTVSIGILQTIEGYEDTLHQIEWFAVIIFSIEYILRLLGAPADPSLQDEWFPRISYIFSFYSFIDLLAIIPLYVVYFMPDILWINDHDEYLRMLRIIRLVKLDKYVPSITLIDDVLRLKKTSLFITGFAATTLWIIFSGLLYLTEHNDVKNGIDDVPIYGCDEDCTMSDRFQNFFDSMIYTGIHLTGDYPIIEYTFMSRIVNFFMVIAAVGIVGIPSGIIASGFSTIIGSTGRADGDDDWYENQLSKIIAEDIAPPESSISPIIDHMQLSVHEFLNGKMKDNVSIDEEYAKWSVPALICRMFIFSIIIANVVAVLLESIPFIDKYIGNEPGNAFDVFEIVSVCIFTLEYALRLFSAPKNRDALYSPWVYATTFFGIVDFLSIAPWYIETLLLYSGYIDKDSDAATVFRLFRIFRIFQLEDFFVAFSKLDDAFRASKDALKATGLMASIIWVGCAALFFIFEKNNPNWRVCDEGIPLRSTDDMIGCYDFSSTRECKNYYGEDTCHQTAFVNMLDSLYYVAVFLGGEWGLVDFTWGGRMVCMFLCVAGIALYALPVGTFFNSFGAILGLPVDD